MDSNPVRLMVRLTAPSNRCFNSNICDFSPIENQLKDELKRAGASIPDDIALSLGSCSRLWYEEELLQCQLPVHVYLPTMHSSPEDRIQKAAFELSRKWCEEVGRNFNGSTRLEFLSPESYYNQCAPMHPDIHVAGFSLGSFRNLTIFDELCSFSTADERRKIDFEHTERELLFYFMPKMPMASCPDGSKVILLYRICISYESIHSIIVHHGPAINDKRGTRRSASIYLRLKYPPKVFRAFYDRNLSDSWNHQRFGRVRDFPGCKVFDVGRCDVWKLVLHDVQGNSFNHVTSLHKIISRMKIVTSCRVFYTDVLTLTVEQVAKMATKSELTRMPCQVRKSDRISFKCFYLLIALHTRNYRIQNSICRSFFNLVCDSAAKDERAAEAALTELLAAADEYRYFNLEHAFVSIFERESVVAGKIGDTAIDGDSSVGDGNFESEGKEDKAMEKAGQDIVKIRKIVITPTRFVLMAPEPVMSNRVLRKFDSDYALRVVIRDEDRHKMRDWSRGRGRSTTGNKVFEQWIKDLFLNGIKIADRHYRFLAWSNSQLGDHAFYMYSTTPDGHNVDSIRHWMGDFSGIKNTPKYLARMGQCFTQTQRSIELPCDIGVVIQEGDIYGCPSSWSPLERYIFSDGIGRISQRYATMVCEELKISPLRSAYQIRYAGYKGVLCVDTTLDLRPDGPQVLFRDSMYKFRSQCSSLEIVKYSQPTAVCLNRPLIMILDQVSGKAGSPVRKRNVEHPVWCEIHHRVCNKISGLLNEELFSLANMLLEEDEAVRALSSRTPLKFDFGRLREAGFELTTEPFFRGMLMAIHKNVIKNQLLKLKIPVSPEHGRTMYGVLDTTKSLEPGQIFVQYSSDTEKPGEDLKILPTGTQVMVTKNPSTVSGDVRLLTAVDVPELHDLYDVVVFPQTGPRPHPDEMAGSDLDGDEYSLYWDERLLFHKNQVRDPMEYPKQKPVDRDCHVVTDRDISNFFWEYIHQDSVGKLAYSHLAVADRCDIDCEAAHSIARKYSIALDYAKNGIAAVPLTVEERPKIYPDYLAKFNKPMYKSQRLVGKLYRRVKYIAEIIGLADKTASSSIEADYFDKDLEIAGWEAYKEDAQKASNQYSRAVQGLLDQYGVSDEWSLISGHMVSIRNRFSDGEKEDYSYWNAEKIIELEMNKLRKRYRRFFLREFKDDDPHMTCPSEGMCRKASAWYIVAYRQDTNLMGMKMRSFAWIMWDILCRIKLMSDQGQCSQASAGQVELEPIAGKLTCAVEAYCQSQKITIASLKQHFLQIGMRDQILGEPGFMGVCLVLISFISREIPDGKMAMKPIHVIRLLKSYAEKNNFGQLNGNGRTWNGGALLGVLKFLATCDGIAPIEQTIGETGLSRELDQLCKASAKCLHHIAWTHGFMSLHIEDSSGMFAALWHKDEMTAMTVVLPKSADCCLQYTEQLLRSWSGADQVRIYKKEDRRLDDIVLIVSAYGTLDSRQKLYDILLAEDLHKRLTDKKRPKIEQDSWFAC